jgi:CRISPR-associated protein Csx3
MPELRYHAELRSYDRWDILQVGFSRNFRGEGNLVVKDAIAAVENIEKSGQLRGKCLLIDGAQSIAVAYALSHKLSHRYGTIAVLDPKIGRRGYKTFIVTSSHGMEYEVGSLIETEETQIERNCVKIALCGPPHSGKSCLREGLRACILETLNAPYPYTIPGCPDGEAAGFQEIKERDPQYASIVKQGSKGDFTENFTRQTVQAIESASTLLNIIDLGGRLSEENQLFLAQCTHAIILVGDDFDLHVAEWEAFCQQVNVPVIAKIHSDLNADSDRIDTESPLTGTIHQLQGNGQDLMSRPIIQALARMAIDLTTK